MLELLLPALCTWLHVATTRQLLLYDKYEFVPPSLCVCVCAVSSMNKAFPNSNRVMSATHFPVETMTDVNQRATSCITPAIAPTGGGRQEIFLLATACNKVCHLHLTSLINSRDTHASLFPYSNLRKQIK